MKNTIAVIVFTLFTYSSLACDCLMYKRIENYVDKVDIIFTGKVISLLDSATEDHYFLLNSTEYYKHRRYTAKILVIEKLKTGEVMKDTLNFTSDYSNCYPLYELGETYLFFANRAQDEWFKMVPCTPWGTISETKKEIKQLRRKLARKESLRQRE